MFNMSLSNFFSSRFAFLSIVFSLFALASLNTNAQHVNIYPTILDFQIGQPGEVQTEVVNITNNSNSPQAVRAYFGDWNRNEDGSHTYYEAGTQQFSCALWSSVDKNLIELAPGESKQIVLTLTGSENIQDFEKMKWAMLFLESTEIKEPIKPEENKVITRINDVIRFGLHIYQTPPSLNKYAVDLQSLDQSPEDGNYFDLGIENQSELMIYSRSHLELTNIETGEEFSTEKEECPIFPLGKRKVSLHLPENLPSGKYSMLAIMDYGDPNSLEAIERIIEIK